MKDVTERRYRRFVMAYLIDFNATHAYKHVYGAGQLTAESRGANLLKKPYVQQLMREESERALARLELQFDRTMLETCRVAYSNLKQVASWGPDGLTLTASDDLPDDVAAAVQDVKCTKKVRYFEEGREEEVQTQIKLHSKLPALKMLQEFFRRGDPLSAEADAKIKVLLMIMAHYVPRDRLDDFRAHVITELDIDISTSDDTWDNDKQQATGHRRALAHAGGTD